MLGLNKRGRTGRTLRSILPVLPVLLFSLSKNYFNREADGSDETNNKQTIKNRDRKISRFIVLFIPKDQIIYSVSFLAVSTMSVFSPLISKSFLTSIISP